MTDPTPPRRMYLNAFLMGVGHHEAAWRHPRSEPQRISEIGHYIELAQKADRAGLDSVFFADSLAIGPDFRRNMQFTFEPLTLLAALAVHTNRIGLIATASTSYHHPYHLARVFGSVDLISHGRVGWNIVTSGGADEARNFGFDDPPTHSERYSRADEFVELVTKLWGSWQPDALRLDVHTGDFVDGTKVSAINHSAQHFSVAGPLNVPRSPQGRPILVQAGSSPQGIDLAAKYADIIFTAQRSISDAQSFSDTVRSRVLHHGRPAQAVKILPGIVPYIGASEADARRLETELTTLISADYGLRQLSNFINTDVTGYSLDTPLRNIPPTSAIEGHKSRVDIIRKLAEDPDATIGDILAAMGGGRGHRTIAGTPEQIADDLITWFHSGAVDGFNIMPPLLPSGLDDFINHVLPILRRRGVFSGDYPAGTLRENLHIPTP
ncbi:MAG: LLM class flavin-dependent oxidoreductase [Gordonia sp. (in: high G+C Gram-positive bacteria)]